MIRIFLILLVVGVGVFAFAYHRAPSNLLVAPDERQSWNFQASNGANAAMGMRDGALCCNITRVDGNRGDVEFAQVGPVLQNGHHYRLSFTAKADQDHELFTYACASGMDGYKTELGLSSTVTIPMEWKSFDIPFDAKNADGKKDRVPALAIGGSTGNVWFKNISLVETN